MLPCFLSGSSPTDDSGSKKKKKKQKRKKDKGDQLDSTQDQSVKVKGEELHKSFKSSLSTLKQYIFLGTFKFD